MTRPLLVIALVLAVLAAAAPAGANVTVAGTGEPAFTNSATNTQWINWQGSPSYETYQLVAEYYDDSVKTNTVTTSVAANGSATNQWVNWGGATLTEGHTYGICVLGKYAIGGIPAQDGSSCIDGAGQNKRTKTTIDRTKPSIAVAIDGGAAFSRTANLGYRIDYSDNLAFPFPANFICRDVGTDPAQACTGMQMLYSAPCSVPDAPSQKDTFFDCSDDLSQTAVADGPVTLCVMSADAAVPDNPSNSDQQRQATQANLSDRVCDSITIDRTAPTLTANGPVSATTGELLAFTTQASDAASGLAGAYEWSWGDGASGDTGATAQHTYAHPGAYTLKVTTTDVAGNSSSAERTVVVTAPAQGGPDTGGQPPASDVGQTPGSGNGNGTPPVVVTKLDASAPKRVKAGKRLKSLALAVTAGGPGRAAIALVRAGRVHAQSVIAVNAAGTRSVKLKLPRRLAAGKYSLKISWTPAGATSAQQISLKLAVVGKAARKVRASSATGVSDAGAPLGLPDGRGDYSHVSHRLALTLG